MPRVRQYLDKDVVTAARERIEHVYDVFDSCVVMFSGGKDSSALLWLVKEYHEKNGLGPVEAVFRDQEFLPPSNIEFVNKVRQQDWVNLRWYCLPTMQSILVLDHYENWLQWDPQREHVRPVPEWAITMETLGHSPDTFIGDGGLDQDDVIGAEFKGRVAFMTGVRASESLVRYRSVVNKLNENYINAAEGRSNERYRMVKPIYDWLENDVLKFLYEEGIGWADVYEGQEMAGDGLRIAVPLGLGAKRFGIIREIDPDWYNMTVEAFPQMQVLERYGDDFDKEAFLAPYLEDGFEGVARYIEDAYPPGGEKDKAIKRMTMYIAMWQRRPEEFPPELLLRATASGVRERKIRGTDPNAVKIDKKRK